MFFKVKWAYDIFTMLTMFSVVLLVSGINNAMYSASFVVGVVGVVLCSLHEYRHSEDHAATKKLLLSKAAIMLVVFGVAFVVLGKLY